MLRASLVVVALTGSAWAGNPAVSVETKTSKATADSSLTVDVVTAKLTSTYRAHIDRCYRERYGTKKTARGSLKLAFGVEANGKTSRIVVESFDKKLDRCIATRVKSWRFAPPKDATNKAMATGFVFELAIAPMPDSMLVDKEDAKRFAELLSAEPSVHEDDMISRKPGADLGSQIRDVQIGGTGSSGGGGSVVSSGTKATGPSGRISVSSKAALDQTSLTPDLVLNKILSAYMPGLKRCYKNALSTKPTLRGKVQLAFTVEPSGRTSAPAVTSPDPAMTKCIENMMASWRFPAPTNAGQAATAQFEIGLTFVPD